MRCRKCPPRTAGCLPVSAISETCPPGEGMLWALFVEWRAVGQDGSPARPGTGRQAACPGRALGCHRDGVGSGAAGAALTKRRKSEPRSRHSSR
jgi:hypothetical protein